MEYRILGRTGLKVSVVGVGTAQFRMIPEEQALETLRTAFSLGVNIVHAAPDYEGALDLVARAVRQTQQKILVCTQGHGDAGHMEFLFQEACRKLDRETLEMFGLACIDDRELLGENVWRSGGQIEFLQKKKQAGKIKNLFCTTHGSADYLKKLITADVFDALFFAFNPLGYHLLSYYQRDRQIKEQLEDNAEIIELAAKANIGVMIMKPLAGGLLCSGKAFPEKSAIVPAPELTAAEVLRHLLTSYPKISCVMPGTASPEEARENAQAGHELSKLEVRTDARTEAQSDAEVEKVENKVAALKRQLCSRCGECEQTCDKNLPISWLFRAAYVHNTGAMVFETLDQLQYRVLHPWEHAACASCENRACRCSQGLDIPVLLCEIHATMQGWEKSHWLPSPAAITAGVSKNVEFAAELFSHNLPSQCLVDNWVSGTGAYTVILKNSGLSSWRPTEALFCLHIRKGHRLLAQANLRGEIPPGENAHFSFLMNLPSAETGDLVASLTREMRVPMPDGWGKRMWRKVFSGSDPAPFFTVSIRREEE